MHKKIRLAIKLFISVAILLFMCGFAVNASAETVFPSGDKTGATDKRNIQKALNTGGTITLQNGSNYFLNGRVIVKVEGTKLIATGAVITQKAIGVGMIRNDFGDKGGYDGIGNFSIIGGDWVENVSANAGPGGYSVFFFAHAKGIKVQKVVFRNAYNAHMVEFAGCKDSIIENCTMGGKYVGTSRKEAIQLDITHNSDMVGAGPKKDDTPCYNITIRKNHITFPRGIGSHAAVDNHYHNKIRIQKNTINTQYEGILLLSYYNTTIEDNIINAKLAGINFRTASSPEFSWFFPALKKNEKRTRKNEKKYKLIIRRNKFSNVSNAILLYATSKKRAVGTIIKNNVVYNSKRTAIWSQWSRSAQISNNTISNVTGTAIYFSNGASSIVNKNTIKNASVSAVSAYKSASSTISSNKISKCKASAIMLTGSNSVKVNKNAIAVLKSGRGIEIQDSANGSITKNKLSAVSSYNKVPIYFRGKVSGFNVKNMRRFVVKDINKNDKSITGKGNNYGKVYTVLHKKSYYGKFKKKQFVISSIPKLKKSQTVAMKQNDKGKNVFTKKYTVK